MAKELICLNCIIPSCDEADPQCLYSIFKREDKKERNRAAVRRHYERNRESVIERVSAWYARNIERRREYQRERYRRLQDERINV